MKLPNEIEQAIEERYSVYDADSASGSVGAHYGARITLEHVRAVILGTKAQDYDECLASMCNDTYRNQGRAILRQELLYALGMTVEFIECQCYGPANPVETGEGDEELIAKAIYSRQAGMHPEDWAAAVGHEQPTWSSIPEWKRDEYRSQARAVIAVYGKPPALDPETREAINYFQNRRNLAYSLRAESPHPYAFMEATADGMEKYIGSIDSYLGKNPMTAPRPPKQSAQVEAEARAHAIDKVERLGLSKTLIPNFGLTYLEGHRSAEAKLEEAGWLLERAEYWVQQVSWRGDSEDADNWLDEHERFLKSIHGREGEE